jgi:hypothetical protein
MESARGGVIDPNFSFCTEDAIREECCRADALRSGPRQICIRAHSLDVHLRRCIIQRTYGFGLAPLTRGKLLQGQEREQRHRERLCELMKCALIHRSDFADQSFRVKQARLRKVRDGFAVINFPEREIVAADARMPNKRGAEERLRVEGTNDENWAIVFFAGAVQLIADIHADCAPPDLARVVEGAVSGIIDFLLVPVPAVEILIHRCAMEDMIARPQLIGAC